MNKLQKWILGLQIITVILAIAFISVVSYFIIDDYKLNEKYKISYIKPTVEDIIWDKDLLESKKTIDEDVIIDKVDDLFTVNYSWSKSNLSGSTKGISNISKKHIIIDEGLSNFQLVFVMAHELVHIQYYTRCERFCNLQAYKILFDSNDIYFKNVALYFADNDNMWSYEYKFKGYIIDSQGNYRR